MKKEDKNKRSVKSPEAYEGLALMETTHLALMRPQWLTAIKIRGTIYRE